MPRQHGEGGLCGRQRSWCLPIVFLVHLSICKGDDYAGIPDALRMRDMAPGPVKASLAIVCIRTQPLADAAASVSTACIS